MAEYSPVALSMTEYVVLRETKTLLQMQIEELQKQVDLIDDKIAQHRAYEKRLGDLKNESNRNADF